MSQPKETNLAVVERTVEARSGALKKELGLFDLVLTQIVFVFGTVWVGFAATLGRSQISVMSAERMRPPRSLTRAPA